MKFLDVYKENELIVNKDGDVFRCDPLHSIPLKWLSRDDWEPFSGIWSKVFTNIHEIRHHDGQCLRAEYLSGIFSGKKCRVTIEEIK